MGSIGNKYHFCGVGFFKWWCATRGSEPHYNCANPKNKEPIGDVIRDLSLSLCAMC